MELISGIHRISRRSTEQDKEEAKPWFAQIPMPSSLFTINVLKIIFVLDLQSLVANEDFQHILRVQNTNVDGKQKIMFALTSIKGIGRRFANIACKKADIDMNKR